MTHFIDMPRPATEQERTQAKFILHIIIATLTAREVENIGRINPFLLQNGFYTYMARAREWDSYGILLQENGKYSVILQRWAPADIDREHRYTDVALEKIGETLAQGLDWDKPYRGEVDQ